MNWNLLIGPLVGGVIGYITNGIAIKMLFRPLKAVYIFGKRLPFTPGLIPKEKERISRSIGQVVGRELVNEEVLSKALLGEEIYRHINNKIDSLLSEYKENSQTLGSFLNEVFGEDRVLHSREELQEAMTDKVYQKLVELDLGKIAVAKIMEQIKGGLDKSLFGAFSFFINDSLIESVAVKLEPVINKMVIEESRAYIESMIQQEGQDILDKPISEIAMKLSEYEEVIKTTIIKAYNHFVHNSLSKALEIIDISKIVTERVVAFDTLEFEKIILEIMAKELNAIIWLGALLGFIMGCVMNLA